MRLAYILTHPIQYQTPLIRHLRASGVDLEVVYATDITARSYHDAGFGAKVEWDLPLLDGYPSHVLFPGEELPAGPRDFRRYQAVLSRVLEVMRPGAVWVHGWGNGYLLAAVWEARRRRLPVLIRGEASLQSLNGGPGRRLVHRMVLSLLFRSVSQFLAIGTANREFYRHHGVPEDRIHHVPYVVDNMFFQQRCREARPGRESLRVRLGITPGRPVLLFCAKLIAVKDPATLIRAVGKMASVNPVLLMVGEGDLRSEMESLAQSVAPGLVKFLGFRNQTELPALYDLCDLFVLPSAFEPWGLVVNEVMNAGKAVIVSDAVGAARDLVQKGVNGDIFKAGDSKDLHARMLPWLQDGPACAHAGTEGLRIIHHWGFGECVSGLTQAMRALQVPPSA